MFGLCDGLAPLVGILVGHYCGEAIGETGEYVGAIGLGLYGLYLVVKAWRTEAPEEMDRPWAVFGLIVPLSADNIVAGTSLGLLGVSPWLAPLVFGVTTALMALVGCTSGERRQRHPHPPRSPDRRGARRHGHRDGAAPAPGS